MKKAMFEKFKKNNEIISIYVDLEDINAVYTGYVYDVDENYLVLYNLAEKGIYDGHILFRLKDIFRVDYDTEYESFFKNENNNEASLECDVVINDNFMLSFLKYSKENYKAISICIEEVPNTTITGICEEYDDIVCLSMFDEYGNYEGKTCININDVSRVYLDTDYEKTVNQLIN